MIEIGLSYLVKNKIKEIKKRIIGRYASDYFFAVLKLKKRIFNRKRHKKQQKEIQMGKKKKM